MSVVNYHLPFDKYHLPLISCEMSAVNLPFQICYLLLIIYQLSRFIIPYLSLVKYQLSIITNCHLSNITHKAFKINYLLLVSYQLPLITRIFLLDTLSNVRCRLSTNNHQLASDNYLWFLVACHLLLIIYHYPPNTW